MQYKNINKQHLKWLSQILIAILFIALLSGCPVGIHSHKPALNKNDSDAIDGVSGYWRVDLVGNAGEKDNQLLQVVLLEDESTGIPFFKDHLYKLKLFGEEQQVAREIRAKKSGANYAIQLCFPEKNDIKCRYGYLTKQGDNYFIYPLHDDRLSSPIKDLLGDLYINAKNRNEIELTDEFVAKHGKKLMGLIASETIKDPTSEEDLVISSVVTKISGEEARSLVDKKAAEAKQKKAEDEAKRIEEKRIKAAAAEETRKAEMANYGLKICNQSNENMFLAYGHLNDSEWETVGWYTLDIGACETLGKGTEISGKTFYYHAEGKRGTQWGEGYFLCVHPKNAFTIKGTKACNDRGYQKASFSEIKVPDGKNQLEHNLTGGKPSRIDSLPSGGDEKIPETDQQKAVRLNCEVNVASCKAMCNDLSDEKPFSLRIFDAPSSPQDKCKADCYVNCRSE